MSKLLSESTNESTITGLRIGRYAGLELNNVEALKDEISQSTFDIIKFNLLAYDAHIYSKLDSFNYPYYLLGIVMQYRINFKRMKVKPLYHENAEMIAYEPSMKPILYNMAYEVFFELPGSFFQNPALVDRVEKRQYAQMLANYACTFEPSCRENHYTYLLRYKNEHVGFISFYFEGENGFAEFAGVRPSKTPGFYIDLVRFIQNHCIENNIHWGHASAQLQNTVVHKVYQREDMIPFQSYINIHLNVMDKKKQ